MNALDRGRLKAAEYRTNAETATLAGETCGLDHVRAKHERAARRWTELAELEDSRASQSRVFRGNPALALHLSVPEHPTEPDSD